MRPHPGIKIPILAAILVVGAVPVACAAADLTGLVLDRENRRPIPLVEVRLDGSFARLTAQDGTFRIPEPEEGRHTLAFTHISYAARSIDITWPPTTLPVIVTLQPTSYALDEVLVRGEIADVSFPVRSTALTHDFIIESAGNIANDPLRTIQSQPSVAFDGIDFNSRAAIRGGDPEEHRVYFDGYPMAHYAHHGGFAGLIYDDLLRETVLIPGGAPLRFRGNLSGTILMSPMSAEENRNFFRCDITSLAAAATRRMTSSFSMMGSVKSSFFNLPVYQQAGVKSKSFRDLLARTAVGAGGSTELTALLIGATDEEIGSPFEDIETSRQTRSVLAGATLTVPRGGWTGRLRMHHSYFHSRDDVSSRGEEREHRLEGTYLSGELEAETGPAGLFVAGQIGALEYEGYGGSAGDYPAALSVEGRLSLLEQSVLVIGAGTTREPWTEQMEPEAYGSFTLGLHRRWRLAVGYRRSHQTPFLFTETRHFATVPVDPGALMRGYAASWEEALAVEMDQVSIHGEIRLADYSALEADGFRRQYRNLATWQWSDSLGVSGVGSGGAGDGFGYEIAFRRRHPGGLSLSVSFSHAEIRKREGTLAVERPGDFDMPRAWRLSCSYPILETTTISVAWQDLSGRPYTPLDLNSGLPEDHEVNALRLPRFQRLDVKIQQRLIRETSEVTFFVDVLNLLDRDNVAMRSALEISPGEYTAYRYWGTTFFPIVGVSATW